MRTMHQIDEGKDLLPISAEDSLRKDRMAISTSTAPKKAELMEKNRLMNLPVEESGILPKAAIRLDLLRILL